MPYTSLRKGRHSAPLHVYHITTVTRGREPIFSELWHARVVIQELMCLQREGLADTLCFVLMPDHLHWLMQLRAGTLSGVVRLLKGRSARRIGRSVWQLNFHDHALRSDEDLLMLARYIAANPLRSALVSRLED